MTLVPRSWLKLNLDRLSFGVLGREGWSASFGQLPREDRLVQAEQIHGAKVRAVGEAERGKRIKEVDGLVTLGKEIWLGIRVADCIPLFLFSQDLQAVGIAHVGWRGLGQGVAKNAVKEMQTLAKISPDQIYAVLGPSAGGCCYTVGKEVVEIYQEYHLKWPSIITRTDQGDYLDLRAACFYLLNDLGLGRDHLWAPPVCTICQRDRYYSYRRSKGQASGQNRCFIGKTS